MVDVVKFGGDASNWGYAACQKGFLVYSNPAVGSVAWDSSGDYGHVAWVSAVNSDNTITIEEYNYNWDAKPNHYGLYYSQKVSPIAQKN